MQSWEEWGTGQGGRSRPYVWVPSGVQHWLEALPLVPYVYMPQKQQERVGVKQKSK